MFGWPRPSNVVGGGAVSNASIGAKAGPRGATAASTCALVADGPNAFRVASTLESLLPATPRAEMYC
jgi:hypothetical protein